MPALSALPKHLRPRREKVFGVGRPSPLDREARVRIMHRARALSRRTEPGKHRSGSGNLNSGIGGFSA